MTRRSMAHIHPTIDAAQHIDGVQSNTTAGTLGGFSALLESATQPILAVTYWFDPAPHAGFYPITVRFSGSRVDVKGRVHHGDRFVQDETIEQVVPGSGPISLTARVRGINAGSWAVTAHILKSAHHTHATREYGNEAIAASLLHPAARFWSRWVPSAGSSKLVRTCPTPVARVPGILPGIWGAMVTLSITIALALQFLVISDHHLAVGPWLLVSLIAIVFGIVGAKVWFIVVHRHEHLIHGWCIQGFNTGAILAAAILLVLLEVPAGVFLDVTAPGLLIAMAVGRVGCFFAGCCTGRPTASRWGIWSSDQRVGARRIPTQLLELLLALSLGVGVLVVDLAHGPVGGAFFVGSLSAYTLGRQGILQLRAEPRMTRLGGLVTAALASLGLAAAVVLLVR
jgi:phosphatidylglycerol---prolipoprotein diacylglyceryl transferase